MQEVQEREEWAEEDVRQFEGQQVFLIQDSPGDTGEEGIFDLL